MERKLTIGVIHWDCALPKKTTFFGYHATKSLSPAKYRNITPYYADILSEHEIDYHVRTVEEYETELQYAIDCGIDYFAYCWYGDTKETEIRPHKEDFGNVSDKVWELAAARKLHMKSGLKEKIKLCAILPGHPMLESELDELAEIMEENFYQKIDGKPLVYVFNEYDTEKIAQMKKACKKRGFAPHIAIIASEPKPTAGKDYSETDSVCAYACIAENVTSYDEMSDELIRCNEMRKGYGVDVIPFYSVGWNPSPRIDNIVPWIQYPEVPYAPLATEEELLSGAGKLVDWMKENQDVIHTNHIMTFAWNEFEEGGHICPTYGEDGKIDLSRLEAFGKVVKCWKENL